MPSSPVPSWRSQASCHFLSSCMAFSCPSLRPRSAPLHYAVDLSQTSCWTCLPSTGASPGVWAISRLLWTSLTAWLRKGRVDEWIRLPDCNAAGLSPSPPRGWDEARRDEQPRKAQASRSTSAPAIQYCASLAGNGRQCAWHGELIRRATRSRERHVNTRLGSHTDFT